MYKELTEIASVIFKNLGRMGEKKPEKQETQCFYLKKDIKKEPDQPDEFQFLKKKKWKRTKKQRKIPQNSL